MIPIGPLLEIAVAVLAGMGMGFGMKKQRSKQRCAASWKEHRSAWNAYQREWVTTTVRNVQCEADADSRCLGGNCTFHCRDEKRCNGACIKDAGQSI